MEFTKQIEERVAKTIKDYSLIGKKEKILVACSGGKDSTSVLYILNKLGYKVEAITVDALIGNYTKKNLENIQIFCKELGVKLHVISFRDEFGYSLCYLRSILNSKGQNWTSCTICGVLRRYLLNKYARKLKATKIVTGHNLNDEAQSVVMNLFKNNVEILAKSGPISRISSSKFIPRIKPLYFIKEKEVEKYSKMKNFPVKYGHCPCRVGVYRNTIDEILLKYEKDNSKVHENIIDWFLKVSPSLKEKYKGTGQEICSSCGEPARKETCMTCQILSKLK